MMTNCSRNAADLPTERGDIDILGANQGSIKIGLGGELRHFGAHLSQVGFGRHFGAHCCHLGAHFGQHRLDPAQSIFAH